MTNSQTIRRPGEGRRIGIVGDVYRFLATGEETDGKYATFEALVPPGCGPPPHIHSREEESFLVLEGQIAFQNGEERLVADVGTFVNMPVGSLHCFKNETDQPARMLISVAPAGLEQMFLEVGQPLDDAEMTPPPSRADIDKLLEAAPRYGVEIMPPRRGSIPRPGDLVAVSSQFMLVVVSAIRCGQFVKIMAGGFSRTILVL
ncbi:cupin domain-containing protein [Symmachiella dynata]|uniref:cupin domain-containing protein n=1 Tax=Symmachiella dynata TaxID=2527995 RepID=UPI001E482AF1|nr:cupin domain-containing protein [Symmachiella dynata]